MRTCGLLATAVFGFSCAVAVAADDLSKPLPQEWEYAKAMQQVAARYTGVQGRVIHVGASDTIAYPYSAWARQGRGKTAEDKAVLAWMHTEKRDENDGWWLCRNELTTKCASTAQSGLDSKTLLNGGELGLPPLTKILEKHKPQIVVLMIGIYDAKAKRPVEEYRQNVEQTVDMILKANAVCVLTTIFPRGGWLEITGPYNEALREIARKKQLPLVDLEKEIFHRRPDDWNGTLVRKDRDHLSAAELGGDPTREPTPENLSKSGFHLRTWLTVKKLAEVKRLVIDPVVK